MTDAELGKIGGGAEGPIADEEVVRRVLAGDGGLFEILMRRHNQRLYRVARAIVRDPDEAEDVMQEAYVNAYAHLGEFAGRSKFSTWLTKIAVYEALGRLRRRGRDARIESLPHPDEDGMSAFAAKEPNPEQQALRVELRDLLETAVDGLPELYRTVFVLREVEGLSTAETAECLDLTEDTVKTRLHRARALLREELYQRAGLVASTAFPFEAPRCDRIVWAVCVRLGLPRAPGVH